MQHTALVAVVIVVTVAAAATATAAATGDAWFDIRVYVD